MDFDTITSPSPLKALDTTGKVGGYLVLYGAQELKDVTGTFFTPETEYGWQGKENRPALYHHGLDPELGGRELGDGWQLKKADKVGLWVETQLNLRDEYEQAVYAMVKAGKLGLSSGTAKHMIEAKNSGEITRWNIVEGSFTPTPAEPRTMVSALKDIQIVPFKSLIIGKSASQVADADAVKIKNRPSKIINLKGVSNMNILEKIKQLVPGLTDEQYAAIAAVIELAYGAEVEEPTTESEPAEAAPAMPDAAIKSAILSALKDLGIDKKVVAPTKAVRPPYQFVLKQEAEPEVEENPAMKSIKNAAALRFGSNDGSLKAISNDLYGVDYEAMRFIQMQAFNRFARSGEGALDKEQKRALKSIILTPAQIKRAVFNGASVSELKADLSEAVDTLGGYLVPEDLRLDMLERLPGLTAIRSGADVVTSSSDVMVRVKVTGGDKRHVTPMRVTWVGDSPTTDQAKTNPTFGVEKTPMHIAMCTVRVPKAVLEDSAYPLSNKLGEWVSQEYALDEDEQFTIGDGIAKPEGILPKSLNKHGLTEVKSGAAAALTPAGLVAMRYGIARQYRAGAVWIMNDTTAGLIAAMLDAQNRPLWQPSMTEGEPDRLLGFPVLTTETMPDVGANKFPILFGNRRGFKVADRVGMSMLRDETTHAEDDLTKFIFRRRLGGQLGEEWSFAVQKVAA
jgi:HK97 family phage major capsid protein